MKREPLSIKQTVVLLLGMLLLPGSLFAQQSNLSCSLAPVRLVNGGSPAFNVTQTNSVTGSIIVLGQPVALAAWTDPGFAIDASATNYAEGNFLLSLGGTLTLSVNDANSNVYSAGDFAGFVIGSSLLNLNALGSLTINTYLNGTLQESAAGGSLVALNSTLTSGAYEVGFYTNQPFNRVEIVINSTLGLGSYRVYSAILRGTGSCTSAPLACNAPNSLQFPTHAAVIEPSHTGVGGALTVGAISNPEAVTDNITTNYASLTTTVSALGTASLAVKDVTTTYPAGTFAGFDIGNSTLLSAAALGNLTLRTYNNSVLQEQRSGNGLLLGSTLLSTSGRQTTGFVTMLPFDEVQIEITQPAGLSLGETRIYSAVLRRFCAGPALACNTPTAPTEAAFPVYVNSANTGITGAACVGCNVTETGNLLDGDATTFATINLTAAALVSGSVAVKDEITDYPAGTFAGFDIENPALLNVSVLNNYSVTTFLNGVQQQTFSGSGLIAAVPSSLVGGSGRMTVGFVSTTAFDEVRFTANQTVGVNLGITRVYSPVLQAFCAGTIGCNSSYILNSPAYPVIVNTARTGVTGAVCALCAVTNPANATSADTTDFARLITTAGVLASASLSVQDAVSTYPAGTIAGFAIRDPNSLLQVSLLSTLTISTYLDGVLQETRAGGQLLNLSALILFINPTAGSYRIGFASTLPFDEIRITATPTAGVIPVIDVFGAFVDTRFLDPAASALICPAPPRAEPDHLSTLAGSAVNGTLRTNDGDPVGLALTYNTTPATAPANGTVSINADGTFTYTPAAGFTGIDSFRYTVCNSLPLCTTATAYVSVVPPRIPGGANRPPLAQNDFSMTMSGRPVSDFAYGNDNDPDGNSLTYTLLTPPLRGTLTVAPNGTYTYTPDSSFIGRETAVLQVCDNGTPSLCTTSLLFLDVAPDLNGPANDGPLAFDDVVTTAARTLVNDNVISNDSDPNGDGLTATLLDAPPAGSGSLFMGNDGRFSFSPAAGYTGTFSVRYTACDGGTPSRCDTATLTITVQPVLGADFTPLLQIDDLLFPSALQPRDFVLNISELIGAGSNSAVVVRVAKPTAFSVTYSPATTSAAVNGGTAVNNTDWLITENALFITCTLRPGVTIAPNGVSRIGFSIARRAAVPATTIQNMTATILSGTGGDSNNLNNQSTLVLTAQ